MADALFINTRPSHRSHTLSTMTNVRTLNLPLLAIDSLAINSDEQTMMANLSTPHYYQALIVTSVEAARRAITYLNRLGIYHAKDLIGFDGLPIIAVGDATAKSLCKFGLSVITPKLASNEGMLAIDAIDALKANDTVLIWRGVGGRRLLDNQLMAKKVRIDVIKWYERCRPHDLTQNYHAIKPSLDHAIGTHTPIFILIASQMAFEHWQELQSCHAHKLHYLSLGTRLFDIIKSAKPNASVHLIDRLDATLIEQVIKQAF